MAAALCPCSSMGCVQPWVPQHPDCSQYPKKPLVSLTHKRQCWTMFSSQDFMPQVAAACLIVSYARSLTVFHIFFKKRLVICSYVSLVTEIFFLSTGTNVFCWQIKAICCLNNYCLAWHVNCWLKLTVVQVQHFLFELSFPCQRWELFAKGERKKAGKRSRTLPLVQGSSPSALQDTAL